MRFRKPILPCNESMDEKNVLRRTDAKMTREISLSPSKIRFMHHRISSKFSDQRSVNETVEKIANRSMNVYDLPLIRVVRRNGYYYAFDNRRLYVYRVLHHRGVLDEIRVKLAPLSKFQLSRFTTTNNGKSVVVSRGITLPHSEATSPPSSPERLSDDDDEVCDVFDDLDVDDIFYDDYNDFDDVDYDDFDDFGLNDYY